MSLQIGRLYERQKVRLHWLQGSATEGCGARGMMVELVRQVHLQKDVGRSAGGRGRG